MFFALDDTIWPTVSLTLQLSVVTTILLLLFAVPLSWWLARSRSRLRLVVQAIVALPLVLPPTVLGFYLLIVLSPRGFLGEFWGMLGGGRLVFSFAGLVIGSVCYSLPFMVQPVTSAFATLSDRKIEVAASLGAGPWDRFIHLALPVAKRGILTGCVLTFAHTMGEFGVVLMIGGNITHVTDVLSITIYEHVESQDYASAHFLSAGLLLISFSALILIFRLADRGGERSS